MRPDSVTLAPEDDEDDNFPKEVSLGPRLTKTLYLTLILLESLKRVFRNNHSLRLPDLETVPADPFKSFVNKLGHICDSAKGGNTVTSFAILQRGAIQYYFTSNMRNEEDYQRTSRYVIDILTTLGQVPDDETRGRDGSGITTLPVYLKLLRMIIQFNQSRITGYIYGMRKQLDTCIDLCCKDRSDGSQAALHTLQHLKPLLNFDENMCGTEEFVDGSKTLIEAISQSYTPSLKEYVRLRTKNNPDRDAPWVVMHHSIGRLLSYYCAIDILLSARRHWPQLFVDFEVHWFPSSTPYSPSLPPRHKLNTSLILGKMSSEPPIITTYRDHGKALEQSGFPLNKTIASVAKGDSFLPFVHAEVNLLSHILRLQAVFSSRTPPFFLNTRYIGTSKPTCFLCDLYFQHHPSGVTVREGHGNFYHNWTIPKIFIDSASGEAAAAAAAAAREREVVLGRVIPMVREEVFRSLRDKCVRAMPNDSWDTPTGLISTTKRIRVGMGTGVVSLGGGNTCGESVCGNVGGTGGDVTNGLVVHIERMVVSKRGLEDAAVERASSVGEVEAGEVSQPQAPELTQCSTADKLVGLYNGENDFSGLSVPGGWPC